VSTFEERFDRLKQGLSDEQLSIVEELERMERNGCPEALRIRALAGSGKTTLAMALVGVWYQVSRCATNGNRGRLLIPAFTRSAVGELRERLAKFLIAEEFERISITTFDSFFRSLLRDAGMLRSGNLIRRRAELIWLNKRLGRELALVQNNGTHPLLIKGIECVTTGRVLDTVLDEVGFAEAWNELFQLADERGYILEDAIRKVVFHKRKNLTEFLETDERWKVTHVLIDEDQDCSREDLCLPIELVRRGRRLILLGDENQSIMSFRGGLGDVAAHLAAENISMRTLTCTTNFRSTKALVRAQNSFRSKNLMPGPSAKSPTNAAEGILPAVVIAHDETTIVELLFAMIDDSLIGHGCSGKQMSRRDSVWLRRMVEVLRAGSTSKMAAKDIGVLVPSNRLGTELETALCERGQRATFDRSRSNPYRTPVADLAIAWVAGPSAEVDIAEAMSNTLSITDALGRWGSIADTSTFADVSRQFRRVFFDMISGSLSDSLAIGDITRLCVQKVCNAYPLQPASERLQEMIRSWGDDGVDIGERLEALLVFLPGLRSTSRIRGKPSRVATPFESAPLVFKTLSEKRRPLAQTAVVLESEAVRYDQLEGRTYGDDEVVIRTIHRSKGMTFRTVILVRADLIGHGRRRTSGGETMQDLCLAYVASSRAAEEHYELALDKTNCFHSVQLNCWRYCVVE